MVFEFVLTQLINMFRLKSTHFLLPFINLPFLYFKYSQKKPICVLIEHFTVYCNIYCKEDHSLKSQNKSIKMYIYREEIALQLIDTSTYAMHATM